MDVRLRARLAGYPSGSSSEARHPDSWTAPRPQRASALSLLLVLGAACTSANTKSSASGDRGSQGGGGTFLLPEQIYDLSAPVGTYDGPFLELEQSEPPGQKYEAAAVPRPTPGRPSIDPTFGTEVRAFDTRFRHHYSQLQAYSTSGRYVLGTGTVSKRNEVRVAATGKLVSNAIRGSSARWIPTTHNVLTFEPDPLRAFVYNADENRQGVHMRFPYNNIEGGRSQEEMDRRARWIALLVSSPQARVLTVDLREKKIHVDKSPRQLCNGKDGAIDYVGVSPHGEYLVVQFKGGGEGRCEGLDLFDIRTGIYVRTIYSHHNHSDLGVSADGRDYVMTLEYEHPANSNFPSMVRYWLDTGEREDLRMVSWSAFSHVSCQGPAGAPCVVSGTNQFPGRMFTGELWLLHHDGSVRHLTHHRSTGCRDYWAQPHASMSPHGTQIIFASDWGQGCDAIGSFTIDLFQRR